MANRTRNQELLEKRNAKIAARYYYLTEDLRWRSDDAIKRLSEEEFFLTPVTIIEILRRSNRLTTDELRRNAKLGTPTMRTKLTPEQISFMPTNPTK